MAYEPGKDYRIHTQRDAESVPGREATAIVAGAGDLPRYARALWINTAGDVTGIPVGASGDPGTAVTFTAVPAGFFPMGFRRITACPAGTLGIR